MVCAAKMIFDRLHIDSRSLRSHGPELLYDLLKSNTL